jgi:TATA-box binding protein (TBP) (component of TFIID and TFIIIB)
MLNPPHPPIIRNIKISLYILNNLNIYKQIQDLGIPFKQTNNFRIISNSYRKNIKITIFNNSFINITGIKTIIEIEKIVLLLLKSISLDQKTFYNYKIDNICCSGSWNHKIKLIPTAHNLSKLYYVRYNPDIYPGIHCKIPNLGSILIFNSGKYSIIGVTCMSQAIKILELVFVVLKNY